MRDSSMMMMMTMTEVEVALCLMSLLMLLPASNISHLYRSAGLLLFELVSCVVVSAMLVVQSQVSRSSLLPTIALISYSAISGVFASVLTIFTVFFLGSSMLDFGAIVLSVYFGFATFRTCVFTGFKSLLIMMIKSPTLAPKDCKIAPLFYSTILAYLCSFSCIVKSNTGTFEWPGFVLLGAVSGRLIGTIYKLFCEKSQAQHCQQNKPKTKT